MKLVTLENKWNRDRFVCDNLRLVEIIDGIEYLTVRVEHTERTVLIRKDSLEKVKPRELVK
jgi:hypothetical protein